MPSSTTGRTLLLLVPAFALSGCATKGDLRNVQVELRALAERQDDLLLALQRQTSMTQDSLRGASDQLLQIRGSVSNQLDRIMDELETIRELSGQNQRAIAGVRDQLEALRRQALMGYPGATSPGGSAVGGQMSPGGGPPSQDATGMYEAAVSQYNRGSLIAARMAFEQFITAYPADELTPEARFRLADIHTQEGRLQDALRAFQQIPELHPTAAKVPDALYRTALLEVELGNRESARQILERVINTYPDHTVAALAEEKLREIGR